MLRQCIEVVGLRRGGRFYICNLSGTASAIFVSNTRLKAINGFEAGFYFALKPHNIA